MPSEKEIIEAVVAGDAEAFATLVRTHQARVRLSCLVFLGNKEEADDAAQDVFVKAFKALSGFKGDSSFETWILRIADNHCRDLLRARKVRRTESLDALLAEKGDALETLISRSTDAGEALAYSSQDLELLGRLFSALPLEDREVLALREVEILSYEEIAQKLNCSLDAVKGRLKRARASLADKCRHFLDTSAAQPRL
jgi:RNA polymerase sigma-70 factor (ECF subfamily)